MVSVGSFPETRISKSALCPAHSTLHQKIKSSSWPVRVHMPVRRAHTHACQGGTHAPVRGAHTPVRARLRKVLFCFFSCSSISFSNCLLSRLDCPRPIRTCSLCLRVHVWVCVCVCTYAHTRCQPWLLIHRSCPPCLLQQNLFPGTQSSLMRLG